MTDPNQLPPEVVKALEMGAVSGINALRSISGMGLYEAKLAVDAYLQGHPDHPMLQRMREWSQPETPTGNDTPWREEVVALDPEVGEAIPLESLPKDVVAAECYVLLRDSARCKNWLRGALKACGDEFVDMSTIDIVDEHRLNEDGDLSGAVLKLLAPRSRERMQALRERLAMELPEGVSVRLIEAARWDEATIPSEELAVEYFVHEFARHGRMIRRTTSCVKLVHLPTGIASRSTAHRRRQSNYEEALLLLASFLKEVN